MAYKILRPDGTTLITLADNVVDQSATSLALVGKNWSGYGEFMNNNFVRLLSNSASTGSKPPRSPITGQIWYDTSVKRLKVYDSGFRTVNGVPFNSTTPTTLLPGDLWYDTSNNQLKLFDGLESVVVGPPYPFSAGENGWVIPNEDSTVDDAETESAQNVLVLKSYGESLAIANSGDAFTATTSTAAIYLPLAYPVPEVVTGITVSGDLRVYGQMTNHGMTTAFNVDHLTPGYSDFNNPSNVIVQNNKIVDLLNVMLPPNTKSTGTYQYPGLPDGSVSRIAVYRNDGSNQVRLFRTAINNSTSTWQAWNLFAGTNIIV
jgi:hypothetical protein